MKLHGPHKNLFRLFLRDNAQGSQAEFLFRTETQWDGAGQGSWGKGGRAAWQGSGTKAENVSRKRPRYCLVHSGLGSIYKASWTQTPRANKWLTGDWVGEGVKSLSLPRLSVYYAKKDKVCNWITDVRNWMCISQKFLSAQGWGGIYVNKTWKR